MMKKILITGANSYIGTNIEKWLLKDPTNYQITTLGVKSNDWTKHSFSNYDHIIHVAGITHVSKDLSLKDLYYKVNTDLRFSVAKKAKEDGAKQFIFLSSIIVYGDSRPDKFIIDQTTPPNPSNFYGDSKLKAEEGIRSLQDEHFSVAIIRSPMVYGKGSKGNYSLLSKFAKITPIFPNYPNTRSVIYILNLCEFIKQLIDHNKAGIFLPQNDDHISTCDLVLAIAQTHKRKIITTTLFNPIIFFLSKRIAFANKIFGNLSYDLKTNSQASFHPVINFYESIKQTE